MLENGKWLYISVLGGGELFEKNGVVKNLVRF